MMKKINKVVSLSAVTLALMGTGASQVLASEWHANTPSEIGELNNDGTYTVRNGDTIWAIGVHFNIKPTVIEEVNHVTDPYLLQIGTILKLHIDKENDKATIEAITPDGQKHEKVLTQKDKIVEHKKFGENVEKDITMKEENKLVNEAKNENKESQAKMNSESSKQVQSSSENTMSSETSKESYMKIPNAPRVSVDDSMGQVAMAAYFDIYKGDISPKESLYFVKDDTKANSYVVGQGTADSTAEFTIDGNTITYEGFGNAMTKPTKGTLNKEEVMSKYYSTNKEKEAVNNAIKNSQTD